MENLQDWCISRQIWFGHQIPVWHKDGHKPFVGIDAPSESGWTQDTDTLDTWFSSGLWTFSTLAQNPDQIKIENGKLIIDSEDFKNFHPTSVMETGYDILFFWVARMIIMTTYAIGDIPFQNVYLHGLIRDENGKKMSKSLGNVIDPLDMIAKYGTDATRLSLVMGSTPGNDTKLSEEKIKSFRNFTNKIWNISRYIIHKTADKKNPDKIDVNELTLSDKWIVEKMHFLIRDVNNDLEKFNFSQAGDKLHNFTWDELADWYLEISKVEKNEEIKTYILTEILKDLLKLWHPFMPFVTEAIWQEMGNNSFLMTEKWPKDLPRLLETYGPLMKDGVSFSSFRLIQEIIKAIRNARLENKIDPGKKITAIIDNKNATGFSGTNIVNFLEEQKEIIKNLRTGVENLEIRETGEKLENSIHCNVAGINIYILTEGLLDTKEEQRRASKEIANLEKYITGLESKLSNADFVAKAPAPVVAKQQKDLSEAQTKLTEIQKHLGAL
jgi:valyl-tRNA synthetase